MELIPVTPRLFTLAVMLCVATLFVAACSVPDDPEAPRAALEYPEAPRGDVVDDYHGVPVADPYRWFEELDGAETAAWVEAQNEVSMPWLEAIPEHSRIEARLTELWDYERYGVPFKEGGLYFYSRNDGLQDQSVWYVADALQDEPRVLIDPNAFSEDGTIALSGLSISPDGRYAAYSTSDGGTDWDTWRVREVASGEDLDDEIRFTKFTGVSWTPDGDSFYYSRYPVGDDGEGDDKKAVRVYRHVVGTPQADDELIYEIPEHPERNPYGGVTEDGRYLVLSIQEGYLTNAVYFRDLTRDDAPVVKLLDDWDARYGFLGNLGSVFYFQTNLDAPRERVIAIDVESPARENWREVIPQRDEVLEDVSLVGGRLIASYLQDVKPLVEIVSTEGETLRTVEFPGLGTAYGFNGDIDDTETFYGFTTFTEPGSIYRYDLETGESTSFKQPEVDVDPAIYETRQVFYESKDGTRVPMFITHREGIELDGDNPTLLYGYGGFNVTLTPSFSVPRMVWLEMGGVLAIPNLRGGGEYGREWHLAGTKADKQNVFDDFIAAAEWLIDEGYTRTERLAIQGGSNGGLLVGAALTQRPDLFGATLPAVGVLDMLRYHTASANARNWQDDYGLSEREDEFRAQLAYSPYHNVEQGTCYPPTLVTTADRDDRVVPWHSFKFGAVLQWAQSCDNPILVRVETRAGHGAGKPTWMVIENYADQWAFLVDQLEMEIDLPTAGETPSG
jgi:prolyl oligopeptidase